MPISVSFDRAAETYDATRGFPPGIADQVADAAATILGREARVVEIGVGTGRIARPLAARGVRVTGVDLSRAMMARLRELLPAGGLPVHLIEGDAAGLPLASGRFDAVLAVHVFHLIAGWQAALTEVRRVMRPGGCLLTGYDWRPPDSPSARLFDQWRAIVQQGGFDAHGPGARDFDDVRAYLLASGAAMDEVSVGAWTVTRTITQALETVEHRTWSSTWAVPDDFFPRSLAELRAWAVDEFGSLEREFAVSHRFVWQTFRWS